MPRKKNPEKPPRIVVPIRMAPAARDHLDDVARQRGTTRSEVVRRILARRLATLKPGDPL